MLRIIAHGSRRGASSEEVRVLADVVRAQAGATYDHVETAFLELADPSIPGGLAALAAKGASEIVAFPYCLAAGTHVAQDIPDAIAEFTAAHPAVRVRLTSHLRDASVLPAAILNVVA